jgi:hypothetical protein
MKDNDFYTMIEQLIDDAFDINLGKKKEKPMEMQENASSEEEAQTLVYESIEDYTSKTGKRFRMLKDQKARGLTREEAFTETFGRTV